MSTNRGAAETPEVDQEAAEERRMTIKLLEVAQAEGN